MRIKHPALHQGQKVVVIIGGGFAGLNAAKVLAHRDEAYVVLIDQRNHHLFQPLLYQVATAGLNPADIASPIRSQFADAPNIEVHCEKAIGVDFAEKIVIGRKVEIEYDYLILACGASHSYFNHPEWEPFAPGLKTLEQATEIRRRILMAFEAAENEIDSEKQRQLLNFIVVGGGPTGVELAGAIADISRTVLVNDFKRIDPKQAQIFLFEAGDQILSSFSKDLSLRAEKDLKDLGVHVQTSTPVSLINEKGVQAGSQFIPSQSVFWAAGVQATHLEFKPQLSLDRAGRVIVNQDLSVPQFQEVYVVGDMASVKDKLGAHVPGLAPAAIQEGRHAAQNILASIKSASRSDFVYKDKGQMATIGKSRAIVQSGRLKMTGFLAWMIWLFIHIFYLIGFKNRLSVMLLWAWSYLFSKRGARLITEREWQSKP